MLFNKITVRSDQIDTQGKGQKKLKGREREKREGTGKGVQGKEIKSQKEGGRRKEEKKKSYKEEGEMKRKKKEDKRDQKDREEKNVLQLMEVGTKMQRKRNVQIKETELGGSKVQEKERRRREDGMRIRNRKGNMKRLREEKREGTRKSGR